MTVDVLAPSDINAMALALVRPRDWENQHGERATGDLRIAEHMLKFRKDFGLSRAAVVNATGVSKTTILRLERGERFFSLESLVLYLNGTRELVEMLFPRRLREYDKWAGGLMGTVATIIRERRFEKEITREAEERGGGNLSG